MPEEDRGSQGTKFVSVVSGEAKYNIRGLSCQEEKRADILPRSEKRNGRNGEAIHLTCIWFNQRE